MTAAAPTRIQRVARVLWVLFSLYLLYGTVIPFDILLQKDLVARKVEAIEWVPFLDKQEGGLAPRPDLLANIVLFVPFGLLGYWTIARQQRGTHTTLAIVSGLGMAQSLGIELLQLFTRTRTTSTTDLIVNTVGVALGVGAGMLSAPVVERLRRSPDLQRWLRSGAAFPALAAAVGVGALTWQPFLFSLDAGDLLPKLRLLGEGPFAWRATGARVPLHFVIYFLFGLAVAALLRENRVRRATSKAALVGAVVALALEPTRLAVHRALPALSDLAANLTGGAMGALAAALMAARRPAARPAATTTTPTTMTTATAVHPRAAWLCVAMFVATLAITASTGLSPYRLSSLAGGFGWVPFLPYYEQATVDAVADAMDKVLQVMPFGFVAGWLLRGRRSALVASVAAVAASSAAIEIAQRNVPGRVADITDVIVAVIGVALGFVLAARGAAWYRRLVEGSEPV